MKYTPFFLLLLSACSYMPKSNEAAHNTRPPAEIVERYLRALEAGDWATAAACVGPSFRTKFQGAPLRISLDSAETFALHQARKRAFPDFRFNEVPEWEKDNQVKIAVYFSGIHNGVLDFPPSFGLPPTPPTGKRVDLPKEFVIYSVENNQIVHTFVEVSDTAGIKGMAGRLGLKTDKN